MDERREITLSQGRVAIVDADKYDDLMRWKWFCHSRKANCYAAAVIRSGSRKQMLMHRYLMGFPKCKVDHWDQNGLHNWMSNLRLASDNDNARNRPKSSRNKSGYIGVYWCRTHKTWAAFITVNGQNQNLGYFYSAEAAALERDREAFHKHGEFATLNFPREEVIRAVHQDYSKIDLLVKMYE